MKKISEELIVRFFQGRCNHKEAAAVLRYLEQDAGAAEKYLGKKEWDEISLPEYPFEEERTARMLENIRLATYQKPASIVNFKWAIAASLLIIMAAGLLVFKNSPESGKQVLAIKKEEGFWRTVNNPTGHTMNFILNDGSEIQLAAHSKVSFQQPFPGNKREIKLTGKAFFKVAKDKNRPFTVFSGPVFTTALGTQFTVDATRDGKSIHIKLHEGKVLVKHSAFSDKGRNEEYYLVPNQELTYYIHTGRVSIESFRESDLSIKSLPNAEKHKTTQNGVMISFNREPVENVFKQLEKAYHVDLGFAAGGFRDYYFTGSFNRADSLERILRIIAATNKMEIIKSGSGYKINKKR